MLPRGSQLVAMKLASLVFFALLFYVHEACAVHEPLHWPLSGFREGECEMWGYALYGAIALISLVYSLDLKRFKDPIEAVDTIGFGVILLLAAASPNRWMLHRACAGMLLACAYVFFAIQFRRNRPVMVLHLCAPLAIAAAMGFESYGLWQKALISYFVIVGVIHHDVAMREMQANAARALQGAQGR